METFFVKFYNWLTNCLIRIIGTYYLDCWRLFHSLVDPWWRWIYIYYLSGIFILFYLKKKKKFLEDNKYKFNFNILFKKLKLEFLNSDNFQYEKPLTAHLRSGWREVLAPSVRNGEGRGAEVPGGPGGHHGVGGRGVGHPVVQPCVYSHAPQHPPFAVFVQIGGGLEELPHKLYGSVEQ